MKENKNNELKKDALEQVAGGGPGAIEKINTELKELQRLLVGERQAYVQALKRLDTSPGADVTAQIAQENIEDLQRLIRKKEEDLAALLEDVCDMR